MTQRKGALGRAPSHRDYPTLDHTTPEVVRDLAEHIREVLAKGYAASPVRAEFFWSELQDQTTRTAVRTELCRRGVWPPRRVA